MTKNSIWSLKDSFMNLVAELGTGKDKRSYGQFGFRELDRVELEAMYENDWLSGKVIDAPVDDMTRNWRTIQAPSIEDKLDEIRQAETDLQLQSKYNEAQKWADLYGGAVIVLVVKGKVEITEPLEVERIRPGDLERLEVFDATQATPWIENVNDPTRADFRKPNRYTIAGGSWIHASRVLRFGGIKLPWNLQSRRSYWDASRLQRFYDALRNSRSVVDSIASMVYESKLDVISVPELYQELASPNGLEKIVKRFRLGDMVKSINNTLLLDSREQFDRKATQFAGLSDIMHKFMLQVSAAADIPVTRLFGQSAMGLNATGEGDERNYYDKISSDQETKLRPSLIYFDEILTRSVLGFHPDDWSFEFNQLRQMTEVERADKEIKKAQRDEIYLRNAVITQAIAARDLKDNRTYSAIDDEYIGALQDVETSEI